MTSSAPSPAATLDALIDGWATKQPSAPFLFDARSSRSFDYAELRFAVEEVQGRLRHLGVASGDRVGLCVADPLTFAAWFLAGLASGLWVAPLDPSAAPVNLLAADRRGAVLSVKVMLSDRSAPAAATLAWRDVRDEAPGRVETSTVAGAVSGGVVLASSGTTGAPKVMALTIDQLMSNATLIARHNDLSSADRGFSPLPLWHINAEVVGILSTLVVGASLVLDERFHRTGFWKLLNDLNVTWVNAVPAIISRLVALDDDEVAPTRVRFVRSASAPLAPTLWREFEERTGIALIESYGMTEAVSQICANPLNGVRKPGSVGVAVGVEVRVLLDGAPAEPGEVGDIEIRGPTVITAYESHEYDDRFDDQGWLRTGDLGTFDDEGYLYIAGRTDDVINRGGEKLYPLDIEDALRGVEGVATIVVVGVADDVFGQVPVAYLQPLGDGESSLDELRDLVSRVRACATERLAKAARPRALRVVDTMPAHATGKIRKGVLRDGDVRVLYEEEL